MNEQTEDVELEAQLDSFDRDVRQRALARLAHDHEGPWPPEGTNVNMHVHSFFSYNAEGYSPSRIAWEARKAGLYAAALCDFDVLDGLEEFIQAGLVLGLRTCVNIETRAYLAAYADVDISSPGENGVTYIMGAGFARAPAPGSPQANGLTGYRQRATGRNLALIERINGSLPSIAIDYEADVLPLTPSGAATERHIVTAFTAKAKQRHPHPSALTEFWAGILAQDFEETAALLADTPALEEAVRKKLVKRGGLGYEPPSVDTFPPVDDFIGWVRACDAIPMVTWLDGTSDGEKDGRRMLECMVAKGAAALNIIPDRNWNIADPAERAHKQACLRDIVAVAEDMALPINIGTEMNKLGLPFVDDLDGPALRPWRDVILRGARIMTGHSVLSRWAAFPYSGEQAEAVFKSAATKNTFFESVGARNPVDRQQAQSLEDMGPDKALAWFRDAVRA